MTREETAKLLAIVRAIDNRVLDEATAQVWHKLLMDLAFTDAAEAVRRHFSESSEYLMPIHVLRGAQAVASERGAYALAEIAEDQPALGWDQPATAPGRRQRGALIVGHVLVQLNDARKRLGGLSQSLATELAEGFMTEALKLYPAKPGAVRRDSGQGRHCGRAGCQCTHTDGCDAGWIECPPAQQPEPVLFGDQPEPVEDQGGRVRPCANCRPAVVEMFEAASTRRGAQQTLRLRRAKR